MCIRDSRKGALSTRRRQTSERGVPPRLGTPCLSPPLRAPQCHERASVCYSEGTDHGSPPHYEDRGAHSAAPHLRLPPALGYLGLPRLTPRQPQDRVPHPKGERPVLSRAPAYFAAP